MTKVENYIDLEVTVRPRSSRNALLGEYQGRIKIALTSAPTDGKANEALIEFFAELLSLAKRDITLLRGASSKNKTLRLFGVSREQLAVRLNYR